MRCPTCRQEGESWPSWLAVVFVVAAALCGYWAGYEARSAGVEVVEVKR